MLNKLCAAAASLFVACLLAPSLAFAGEAGSLAEIEALIAAAPDGVETEVSIGSAIDVTHPIVIPEGKSIKLSSSGAGSLVAAASGMGYMVEVKKGATLSLDGGLVMDGAGKSYYLKSAGALVMEDAALKNGSIDSSSEGGGVYAVGPDASFTMNGGSISDTRAPLRIPGRRAP